MPTSSLCRDMASEDETDFTEAIVTCEGNLHDPDFSTKFQLIVDKLKSLLYKSRKEEVFKVRKIEPWNSVRVTISIPKEAAQRLRALAQQGNQVLRQLGILSVQVEGDQVISLTLAGKNNEPQELLLTQSNCGPSTSVNCLSIPSASAFLSSLVPNSQSQVNRQNQASTSSHPSQHGVPQSSGPATGLLQSPTTGALPFVSPNVVAPSGESIPLLPRTSAASTPRPLHSGPFSFSSMTHAVHTLQRSDSLTLSTSSGGKSPVLSSSPSYSSVPSAGSSSNNLIRSTNRAPPMLQGTPSTTLLTRSDQTRFVYSSSVMGGVNVNSNLNLVNSSSVQQNQSPASSPSSTSNLTPTSQSLQIQFETVPPNPNGPPAPPPPYSQHQQQQFVLPQGQQLQQCTTASPALTTNVLVPSDKPSSSPLLVNLLQYGDGGSPTSPAPTSGPRQQVTPPATSQSPADEARTSMPPPPLSISLSLDNPKVKRYQLLQQQRKLKRGLSLDMGSPSPASPAGDMSPSMHPSPSASPMLSPAMSSDSTFNQPPPVSDTQQQQLMQPGGNHGVSLSLTGGPHQGQGQVRQMTLYQHGGNFRIVNPAQMTAQQYQAGQGQALANVQGQGLKFSQAQGPVHLQQQQQSQQMFQQHRLEFQQQGGQTTLLLNGPGGGSGAIQQYQFIPHRDNTRPGGGQGYAVQIQRPQTPNSQQGQIVTSPQQLGLQQQQLIYSNQHQSMYQRQGMYQTNMSMQQQQQSSIATNQQQRLNSAPQTQQQQQSVSAAQNLHFQQQNQLVQMQNQELLQMKQRQSHEMPQSGGMQQGQQQQSMFSQQNYQFTQQNSQQQSSGQGQQNIQFLIQNQQQIQVQQHQQHFNEQQNQQVGGGQGQPNPTLPLQNRQFFIQNHQRAQLVLQNSQLGAMSQSQQQSPMADQSQQLQQQQQQQQPEQGNPQQIQSNFLSQQQKEQSLLLKNSQQHSLNLPSSSGLPTLNANRGLLPQNQSSGQQVQFRNFIQPARTPNNTLVDNLQQSTQPAAAAQATSIQTPLSKAVTTPTSATFVTPSVPPPRLISSTMYRAILSSQNQSDDTKPSASQSSGKRIRKSSKPHSTGGKPRVLLNPLTGHLEPIPGDRSSSESDEDEEEGGRKGKGKGMRGKSISRVIPKEATGSSPTGGKPLSALGKPGATVGPTQAVPTSPAEPPGNVGEKIKLRLKLEKNEPSYKVDVTYAKKTEKVSSYPGGVPGDSEAGNSCGSVANTPSEQPRVPPLHISLRGKNSAVVVSPRRDEPGGTTPTYNPNFAPPPLTPKPGHNYPTVSTNSVDFSSLLPLSQQTGTAGEQSSFKPAKAKKTSSKASRPKATSKESGTPSLLPKDKSRPTKPSSLNSDSKPPHLEPQCDSAEAILQNINKGLTTSGKKTKNRRKSENIPKGGFGLVPMSRRDISAHVRECLPDFPPRLTAIKSVTESQSTVVNSVTATSLPALPKLESTPQNVTDAKSDLEVKVNFPPPLECKPTVGSEFAKSDVFRENPLGANEQLSKTLADLDQSDGGRQLPKCSIGFDDKPMKHTRPIPDLLALTPKAVCLTTPNLHSPSLSIDKNLSDSCKPLGNELQILPLGVAVSELHDILATEEPRADPAVKMETNSAAESQTSAEENPDKVELEGQTESADLSLENMDILTLPIIPSCKDEQGNGNGAAGEDSGIDSMDALSEKSPNQGESPLRKEDISYIATSIKDPLPQSHQSVRPTLIDHQSFEMKSPPESHPSCLIDSFSSASPEPHLDQEPNCESEDVKGAAVLVEVEPSRVCVGANEDQVESEAPVASTEHPKESELVNTSNSVEEKLRIDPEVSEIDETETSITKIDDTTKVNVSSPVDVEIVAASSTCDSQVPTQPEVLEVQFQKEVNVDSEEVCEVKEEGGSNENVIIPEPQLDDSSETLPELCPKVEESNDSNKSDEATAISPDSLVQNESVVTNSVEISLPCESTCEPAERAVSPIMTAEVDTTDSLLVNLTTSEENSAQTVSNSNLTLDVCIAPSPQSDEVEKNTEVVPSEAVEEIPKITVEKIESVADCNSENFSGFPEETQQPTEVVQLQETDSVTEISMNAAETCLVDYSEPENLKENKSELPMEELPQMEEPEAKFEQSPSFPSNAAKSESELIERNQDSENNTEILPQEKTPEELLEDSQKNDCLQIQPEVQIEASETKTEMVQRVPDEDILAPEPCEPPVSFIPPVEYPVTDVGVAIPPVEDPVIEADVSIPPVETLVTEGEVTNPPVELPAKEDEVSIVSAPVAIPVTEVEVSNPPIQPPTTQVGDPIPAIGLPATEIEVSIPPVQPPPPIPEVEVSIPPVQPPTLIAEVEVSIPPVQPPTPILEVEASIPPFELSIMKAKVSLLAPEPQITEPESSSLQINPTEVDSCMIPEVKPISETPAPSITVNLPDVEITQTAVEPPTSTSVITHSRFITFPEGQKIGAVSPQPIDSKSTTDTTSIPPIPVPISKAEEFGERKFTSDLSKFKQSKRFPILHTLQAAEFQRLSKKAKLDKSVRAEPKPEHPKIGKVEKAEEVVLLNHISTETPSETSETTVVQPSEKIPKPEILIEKPVDDPVAPKVDPCEVRAEQQQLANLSPVRHSELQVPNLTPERVVPVSILPRFDQSPQKQPQRFFVQTSSGILSPLPNLVRPTQPGAPSHSVIRPIPIPPLEFKPIVKIQTPSTAGEELTAFPVASTAGLARGKLGLEAIITALGEKSNSSDGSQRLPVPLPVRGNLLNMNRIPGIGNVIQVSTASLSSGLKHQNIISIPRVSGAGETMIKLPANLSHHLTSQHHSQGGITVLPSGHKVVKVLTLPKGTQPHPGGGVYQNLSPNATSPTVIDMSNRVSSPHIFTTQRIASPRQPLSISNVAGNLTFVPISANAQFHKVLTSSPVQGGNVLQVMMNPNVKTSTIQVPGSHAGQGQHTIRVIRPASGFVDLRRESMTAALAMTQQQSSESSEAILNTVHGSFTSSSGQTVPQIPFLATEPVEASQHFLNSTPKAEPLPISKAEEETQETTDDEDEGLEDEEFGFEGDIIHDEQDVAVALASAQQQNRVDVVQNGLDHHGSPILSSPVEEHERKSPENVTMENCTNLGQLSSDLCSGDLHGEDQEIIDSFATQVSTPDDEQPEDGEQRPTETDHTYFGKQRNGKTKKKVPGLDSIESNMGELSIEIPSADTTHSSSEDKGSGPIGTRSTRSNTRIVSPDITALTTTRSDTPKLLPPVSKISTTRELRNSPKPSPTGGNKLISPSGAGPFSPGLNSVANCHSSGGSSSPVTVNLGKGPVGKNKRKRRGSDSSSASKDENGDDSLRRVELVDLNARPGKRRCSENAAELIKACIGAEDTPKRNSLLIKRLEEAKSKEEKSKKMIAQIVDESDEEAESLGFGRVGSRGSSEDRSSSRGSSVNRLSSRPLQKDEEKETKRNGRSNHRNTNAGGKRKQNNISEAAVMSNVEVEPTSGKLRPQQKGKQNVKEVLVPVSGKSRAANLKKDQQITGNHKFLANPASTEIENPRRKTRSSAVAGGMVESDAPPGKRKRMTKD